MTERSPIPLPGTQSAGADQVTIVGTATTIIKVAGFSVLTDPNFLHQGERAYIGMSLSTRRLTESALSIPQLPPIDLVVLSHHHEDHFDKRAARDLDHGLPIVTEPHAARKLRSRGFRSPIALSTWQAQAFTRDGAEVLVTSVPGKHSPRPLGHVVPPVMGSVLDFSRDGQRLLRLYVTGDTLMHDGINAVAQRFKGIDLCLLHLGGTRIAGILLTMDGHQGVEALQAVAPREAIPVHYDDYPLFKSPLAEFQQEAEQARLPFTIHYLARGETYRLGAGVPGRNVTP